MSFQHRQGDFLQLVLNFFQLSIRGFDTRLAHPGQSIQHLFLIRATTNPYLSFPPISSCFGSPTLGSEIGHTFLVLLRPLHSENHG